MDENQNVSFFIGKEYPSVATFKQDIDRYNKINFTDFDNYHHDY